MSTNFRQIDEQADRIRTQILQFLPAFLPVSTSRPCPELNTICRLSLQIDCLSALIRNDDLTNMTKRSGLYRAALSFLTTIAKYPTLVGVLLEQRPAKKQTPGLQALGEEANRKLFVVDNSSAGLAPSLVSCCQKTFKHPKAYAGLVQNASILKDINSGGNKEMVPLARELLRFYQTIKEIAPSAVRTSSQDTWTSYEEENRVTFTDDVLNSHFYHNDFSRLRHSPPGRMTVLGRELTSLKTSLPPGIFLKVSEARPDVMKVMIIGVDGSPYAGGLFM